MYTYKATILKIVDGDTVDVEIDLGFDIRTVQRIRLAGLNAPEHNTAAGQTSIKWMQAHLGLGQQVIVTSKKPGGGDKYGRYLAVITPVDSQDGVVNGSINDALIASGNAIYWDGSGTKPVPT